MYLILKFITELYIQVNTIYVTTIPHHTERGGRYKNLPQSFSSIQVKDNITSIASLCCFSYS